MKPSERATEVKEFLEGNASNFQNLIDSNPEHPAVPTLKEAVDAFNEVAAEQATVIQALGDREAVVLHVRNSCETACNRARIELKDGGRPEDVVEALRTAILRAIPLKQAAK